MPKITERIPTFEERLSLTERNSDARKKLIEDQVKAGKFNNILEAIRTDKLSFNEKLGGATQLFDLLALAIPTSSEYHIALYKLAYEKTNKVYYITIAYGLINLADKYNDSKLFDLIERSNLAVDRGDDSSDDEYEAPSFDKEKIYTAWSEFNSPFFIFKCQKSFYSFISHHLGVNILRSQAVHDYYWRSLAHLPAKETFKDLYNRVKKSLHDEVYKIVPDLCGIKLDGYKSACDKILSSALDALTIFLISRDKQNPAQLYPTQLYEVLYERLNSFLLSQGKKKFGTNLIKSHFLRDIENAVQIKKFIIRPTLRPATPLIVSSQLELLGGLFLSLRSSKRRGRHLLEHGRSAPDDFRPIIYSFNGRYNVCELQILSRGEDRSRRDEVTHFGSYTDIADRLKYFGLDKRVPEVVRLLRAILKFTKPLPELKVDNHILQEDFMEFIHQLALLIGGTEAIRNPSAFIHTMMLLDLAEHSVAGYSSWKDILVSKMPMAIAMEEKGERSVVSAARYLHHNYSRYQLNYQYPGKLPAGADGHSAPKQEPKVNELIVREESLTKAWLNWKQGKAIPSPLASTAVEQKNQISLIVQACEAWFPDCVRIPKPATKTTFREILTAVKDSKMGLAAGGAGRP